MIRRRRSFSLMFLTLIACVLFSHGTAFASTQTRDIFVSPRTGVGVGSVWGVFIGVSRYHHAELNLHFADQDAVALHQFFTTQFQGKIPADQFKALTNEAATRGNVLRAIKEVLRRAQPEDLVILSMAMHGLLDTTGQDLYFMTHDADPNFPEDAGIGQDDILKQIGRSKARRIVLFLDACHTGAFGSSSTLLALRSADTAGINRLLMAMGHTQDGIAVFSSSSAAERSQEGEKFCGGHGAFTCGLLTGLQGHADTNRNGLVELRELYDYTYRAVKTSTEGYQNPAIEGRYDNGLPLAYSAAGASAPPNKTADGGGSASSQEMARVLAELDALKQSRQNESSDSAKMLEELKALQKQMAEMQTKPPAPPPVVAKAPAFSAPQRMESEITGQDGASMVLIREGSFWMGSTPSDVERVVEECVQNGEKLDQCQVHQLELPRHRVALDKFYLDRYEVTNRLFEKFVQATGLQTTAERKGTARVYVKGKGWEPVNGASWRQPEGEATVFVSNRREHPVVAVSWEDANTYCRHYGRRLPTEAEWEYAARAGTSTRYWWGNGNPGSRRVANIADESAKQFGTTIITGYNDGYARTAPVGFYDANSWGLHDMIGNVSEWTADWYGKDYYQKSPYRDPKGLSSGTHKMFRGGSWINQLRNVRSAKREGYPPSTRGDLLGFRCAQDSETSVSPQVTKVPAHELSGYQTKLEEAWGMVNNFVKAPGFTKDQRLTALKQFQHDFPKANPHLDDVTGLIQQLEPQQFAKAQPYSAPQRMGKELTGQDGAPMVLIPAGQFLYGLNNQRLKLPTFYMDKYEITTRLYAAFMQATGHSEPDYWGKVRPASDGGLPVVGVEWADANAYCKWASKRLPTEQEWEKAARGTDGRTYPWGNTEPNRSLANYNLPHCGFFCNVYKEKLLPVNSFNEGRSPYGIHHMAGNVWEWVDEEKGIRGGSYSEFHKTFLPSATRVDPPSFGFFDTIGFRCAQDVK